VTPVEAIIYLRYSAPLFLYSPPYVQADLLIIRHVCRLERAATTFLQERCGSTKEEAQAGQRLLEEHVYVKNEGKREKHLWNTPIQLD